MKDLSITILAAGDGKRMQSKLAKVLHPIGGLPMVQRVVNCAKQLNPTKLIIVAPKQNSAIQQSLSNENIDWAVQSEKLGTGHAVAQAQDLFASTNRVLVLYADVPLIQVATLETLLDDTPADAVGILTAELENPFGYGRILRNDDGAICGIVEEKDASPEQKQITEINTGIFVLPTAPLLEWLPALKANNAQKEYYLTDVIAMAHAAGLKILSTKLSSYKEAQGVNTRGQQADLERYFQQSQAQVLMQQGVSFADPARFDLRGSLEVGQDVFFDINLVVEGECVIKDDVSIGPNCYLRDSVIEEGAVVHANSIIEGAVIAKGCQIGPFARIRPGSKIKQGVKIGNFVELKNSEVDAGSKVPHLSYIGDAKVGANVNVGAGTITCNYDGVNKHMTIIEDNVFIGSDTQIIAPVTIGKGSTIAAGTTVTKDIERGHLALSRVPQREIRGWRRPKKAPPELKDES